MLIISGLSGAGKSIVLRTLEDSGFYCVDNLPVILLERFAREFASTYSQPVAVAIDSRNPEDIVELPAIIESLRAEFPVDLVFLTTQSDVLARRFNETRRPHPMQLHDKSKVQILSSIEKERDLLTHLASIADITIDTTHFKSSELRNRALLLLGRDAQKLQLCIQSFGFKNGLPVNADFIFDVRFLPNPYWNPELRPYSGKDAPIIDFLNQSPLSKPFIEDTVRYLTTWIPRFMQNNNRAYLTICFACTGGQHRSVYMAEHIAHELQKIFPDLLLEHRDMKPYAANNKLER